MRICGIKMTHDASVAIIEGGSLRRCVEVEKLANNPRYSSLRDLGLVTDILRSEGLAPEDIDRFVVDGWHNARRAGDDEPVLRVGNAGAEAAVVVGRYHEASAADDLLAAREVRAGLPLAGRLRDYASYTHVAAHIFGAYCTAPFAAAGEPAYVLVWDGGQVPRLYHVDPVCRSVQCKGALFGFHGTIYGIMGHYFGPYARSAAQREEDERRKDVEVYYGGYSIAGKLMSYIALGRCRDDLLAELPALYEREFEATPLFEHRFMRALQRHVAHRPYADADVLLTLHCFLEQLLLQGLAAAVARDRLPRRHLCFTGGSALNIKWNSAIRASGLFLSTWVPPFPNDSGNAIGAACCEMVARTGRHALDWNVYSGPQIRVGNLPSHWQSRPCDVAGLARLMVDPGEPIVLLHGAAELGPRALGHRSIIAPATQGRMKTLLNRIKKREDFRPVAPVCLEEAAPEVFDPGTPDPYMLFDHQVRDAWRQRVPAICHLDGSARLQTVNAAEEPFLHALLSEYRRLTGIPLLCNTSANLNGSGFFPDVESALRWEGATRVWCEGWLYEQAEVSVAAV